MMKRLFYVFTLLIVLGFSATLMGNESVSKYFPATVGSSWVYEDQDGNELTRRAIEGEEIAGETYHAFEYDPAFEDWENYEYHFHYTLFKIDDTGIKFHVGDELVKAYKKSITKELENSMQRVGGPPEFNPEYDVKVEVEAQDHFYLLPKAFILNEEWDSIQIKPTINLMVNFASPEVNAELSGFSTGSKIYFTIMETGIVTGKETVETPAGTFEDCLKIEYRTETVMPTLPGEGGPKAGESVATLWLAPNVGIVKFRKQTEKPLIQEMSPVEATTQVKTFELKKYEIKTNVAESE